MVWEATMWWNRRDLKIVGALFWFVIMWFVLPPDTFKGGLVGLAMAFVVWAILTFLPRRRAGARR